MAEKKSLSKSLKIILAIFCLLILAGGVAYFTYFSKIKEKTPPTPEKPQEEKLNQPMETANWLKYVNQRFHYSVKYPPQLKLDALGEGDNLFTEDVVETGDEGTFITEPAEEPKEAMDRTMVVEGTILPERLKNLSFKDYAENQGHFINPCQEDKAQRTLEVTTQSGIKGIKAWYWVQKGCQGAPERKLNDAYVFFDDRQRTGAIILFFEGQLHDYFDTIVSTFEFIKPVEYGD